MTEGRRPPRRAAVKAVREFLARRVGQDAADRFAEAEDHMLITDGDDGYAFFMIPSDTTSYVHHDLGIEWYGTNWPEGECGPCGEDFHSDHPKRCPSCGAPTLFGLDDYLRRTIIAIATHRRSRTSGATV